MRVLHLGNKCVLVHGRHGYFLAERDGDEVARSLVQYGEFSPDEGRMLGVLVKPGDIVVEVGANIGEHTVQLASLVGDDGQVIAYEGRRDRHSFLQAQIALNNLTTVFAYPYGIGDQEKVVYADADSAAAAVPVQMLTLDGHLEDAGESIAMIKVNQADGVLAVLHGAARLIAQQRPALYLNGGEVEGLNVLLEWLFAAGYRLWWHIPPLFQAGNFFASEDNLFGNRYAFRLLCLPQDRKVKIEGLREVTSPQEPHPALALGQGAGRA